MCRTNIKVKSIEKMIEKHTKNKTFELKSECNLKVINNVDNCVK